MTDLDWRRRGACAGRDPRFYETDWLMRSGHRRAEQAQMVCQGCPVDVQLACARNVIENKDSGVISAGIPIENREDRNRLAAFIGEAAVEFAVKRRKRKEELHVVSDCNTCGKTMRPIRTRTEDYPGMVTRQNAAQCGTCYQRIWAQKRRGQIAAHQVVA
ncbi:WhiB family transcriptional regulator [Speluncibacter jeojiensis]|uniref:WhiB family transcriptional regulator n=1 Tax=Speluncibacter jeojiensis TaxID=2710754 RepID=A0A9X4LWQ2_9ACTN|nr:WhiB family transcriptional regulator [Corynebacteriales bacterium D3-21]